VLSQVERKNNKKQTQKKKMYNNQQRKEMDYDEPHLVPYEKA